MGVDGCAVKGTLDASGVGEPPIPASRGASVFLYAEGKQRETTGRIGLKYKSSVLLTAGIGRGNRVRIAIALKVAATFADASDRMGPARCKIECRMRRRKASEGTNRSRHTVSDVHEIETKQSKQATTTYISPLGLPLTLFTAFPPQHQHSNVRSLADSCTGRTWPQDLPATGAAEDPLAINIISQFIQSPISSRSSQRFAREPASTTTTGVPVPATVTAATVPRRQLRG